MERKRTPFYIGSIAAILYFSEGLPFGIVKELVPLYLRVEHVELGSSASQARSARRGR
jgi:hypothetical protein